MGTNAWMVFLMGNVISKISLILSTRYRSDKYYCFSVSMISFIVNIIFSNSTEIKGVTFTLRTGAEISIHLMQH